MSTMILGISIRQQRRGATQTPTEILDRRERLAVDPWPLLYASRTAAKASNAALQDEYQLYRRSLLFFDSSDGRVIGSSRFHGHDEENSEIEIGWTFLACSHWGGVYNGEMKALMLAHAFKFVKRIVFLVGPENWRSQKALEKIGAVRGGTRSNGRGRPSVVYQITSDAIFPGRHPPP